VSDEKQAVAVQRSKMGGEEREKVEQEERRLSGEGMV